MRNLDEIYEPIADDLRKTETILGEVLAAYSGSLGAVLTQLANYSGKRFRPALLLLTARSRGPVTEKHIQAAATVELIHTASLAHDDVIDGAELRRGRPSLNRLFGNQVSVIAGDVLFSEAFSLMARFASPAELSALSQATAEMATGELSQLLAQGPIPEEQYMEIVSRKTGALCGAACKVGASLSGSPASEQAAFETFGRSVGIAFQIADDCLDFLGEETVVGKTLGTDLKANKWTLPLLRLYDILGPEERSELLELTRRADCKARLVETLSQRGCFGYAYARAQEFARSAESHLAGIEDGLCKARLIELGHYAVARRK